MDRLKRYCNYLLCLVKLIIAFVYVQLNKKKLYSQNTWLIQEKHSEARDNGYHLYMYLLKYHPDIHVFFSIKPGSADINKLKEDTIVDADSIKHYVYYLSAKMSIGSQQNGACPYPTDWVYRFRFLCRNDQKVVFLQHGIIKDDMKGLYYRKTRFDLFVCSARKEYDYVHIKYGYPKEKVKLLGLCRFDNLSCDYVKKQILIMPTYRNYLAANDVEQPAKESEVDRFKHSAFYNSFVSLIRNGRLREEAEKLGYRIVFYLHYSLQSYNNCFKPYETDTVLVADRFCYDVQQLLVESAAMITDFSSVFFDFAYMGKPEVFFQPDAAQYREGHYAEGYFSYENDGFGPVFSGVDETVDYVIELMRNGCRMQPEYTRRVEQFFAFRDNKNCERNYTAIMELN